MRLLIAEDDPKLAGALSRGLRKEGYAVDVAADGDQALLNARVYEYDAVILDIMLPGPDGVSVCRALRDEGRWAPVLMLTALGAVRHPAARGARPDPRPRRGRGRLSGQAVRVRGAGRASASSVAARPPRAA